LDTAVEIGGLIGQKFSSAFVPPEMILKDGDQCVVRGDRDISGSYTPLVAHPSYDCWSLGMVLYELMTGSSVCHSDVNDNIKDRDLQDLYECKPAFIQDKLGSIRDLQARNLVSQLLVKDPSKRLSAGNALFHPFLTGRPASRMVGQDADFDVFISYRVASDAAYAEQCFKQLTDAGLRVWWDQKCLKSGVPWEDGFTDGLLRSRIFLPLISRNSINHPSVLWQNFARLTETSKCDNVLLEYRLALELVSRGLLEAVYPVMIGDIATDATAGVETIISYFRSDCPPDLSSVAKVVVQSVDEKLFEHLTRQGLGTPLMDRMPVKAIFDTLMGYQGHVVEGSKTTMFDKPTDDLVKFSNTAMQAAHIT
jgi:TIR domain/Protein kinase domain